MAEFGPGIDYSFTAAADLSARQYRAVLVASVAAGGATRTLVCSQAGDPIVGILQDKPLAEQAAKVRVSGISKAYAGAAVSAGDVLRTNATGFLVTGNSGYVAGTALTGVASGGVFTIALAPGQSTA